MILEFVGYILLADQSKAFNFKGPLRFVNLLHTSIGLATSLAPNEVKIFCGPL